MMIKKVILCLIVGLMSVANIHAQSEKQARKILDKAANVIKSKGGASANFTLSSAKMGTMDGVIIIKANQFKAKTSVATVWFDGTTQWTYMPKNEEVNITTPSKAQQQAMNPYAFVNLYRTGYNMTAKSNGSNYEVHLTAQNSDKGITEMYIYVNKSTYTLSQIKIKQGSAWTNITISNFKASKVADSTFRFNAKEYPNAEVIDLR